MTGKPEFEVPPMAGALPD